jgi:hypothetical protein
MVELSRSVLERIGAEAAASPIRDRAIGRRRVLRAALIRALPLVALAVVTYDAVLHGLAFLMGHDAYMAAAGLVVSSAAIPPSGIVPDLVRPLIFPAFPTWADYDLFWFAIHAAVASALAISIWLSWPRAAEATRER